MILLVCTFAQRKYAHSAFMKATHSPGFHLPQWLLWEKNAVSNDHWRQLIQFFIYITGALPALNCHTSALDIFVTVLVFPYFSEISISDLSTHFNLCMWGFWFWLSHMFPGHLFLITNPLQPHWCAHQIVSYPFSEYIDSPNDSKNMRSISSEEILMEAHHFHETRDR